MDNKKVANSLLIVLAGLLFSSASSFLEHFAIFGGANDFMRGLFDGLAVVAFAVAIFTLASSLRMSQD